MKSTTDALSTAESREAVIRDDQKERRHKHADDGRDLNKMRYIDAFPGFWRKTYRKNRLVTPSWRRSRKQ